MLEYINDARSHERKKKTQKTVISTYKHNCYILYGT